MKSVNSSNVLPITLNGLKPVARRVLPYCSRDFLDSLAIRYQNHVMATQEIPELSDDFILLCIWIGELGYKNPGIKNDCDAIRNHMRTSLQAGISATTRTTPLSYDTHRPLVRRLANALFVGFNMAVDNSLVAALGDGHEKSNFDAVITWVERTLVGLDLPAQDSVISELIPKLEKELNSWSLQRFN